jgi:oligoribonuclease
MNLFWIDMEMTGLDVSKEVVIEVAAIISDINLNVLDQYHAVVKQDEKYVLTMDDWNKRTHTETGLIKQIPWGKDPAEVEADLIKLLDQYFPGERAILAGNSIGQDRLFIDKYFKKFASRLHYRMLDVTAWKIMMINKFGLKHDKKNNHKALDDITESIGELKYYMSLIQLPKDQSRNDKVKGG